MVGDDLALNANQVAGSPADRELPVIWAVAKGSLINKVIIVPAALLFAVIAPWLVTIALIIGGLYLCYEGAEKIMDYFHKHEATSAEVVLETEQEKIKGAIKTDFVLSLEIIVIALGTIAALPILPKSLVLALIALAMTVGVYGLVALLIKLDDIGLYLYRTKKSPLIQKFGMSLVHAMPWIMRGLTVVGTLAMFIVGGEILSHNLFHIEFGSWSLLYGTLLGLASGFALVGLFWIKNSMSAV